MAAVLPAYVAPPRRGLARRTVDTRRVPSRRMSAPSRCRGGPVQSAHRAVAAGCKAVPMTRVSLSRLPGDRVLVVDGDAEREVAVADLAAYVGAREADGPRWVWDDTARWYPPLLAAGVRVERCHDLRLGHHLLRRAPAVDGQLLAGEQSAHWDRLGPSTPSDPALFSVDDTAEHLRADLEDARQLAAVAASDEAVRLRLLLAAESSGALVAAEMTYAGVPWKVDV